MRELAVIGLGSAGLRHARNALAAGCKVTGFDFDPLRCTALEEAGGQIAANRDDTLAAAEAAVIASPSDCHLDDLTAAVAAGCHSLVEKPLAHRADGLDALLDRAEAAERVVMVGFNLRFHPCAIAAREAIATGRIGQVLWARLIASSHLADWRPWQDYRKAYSADPRTGGVLFDLCHEFDLARQLLGPARTVAAAARCSGALDIAAEDCSDVVLQHDNGALSNMHLDFATRPAQRVTQIAGTEGLVTIDLIARHYTLTGGDGAVVEQRHFEGSFDDDYADEIAAFLAAMDGAETSACTGRDGLAVLHQVIEARRLCALPAA